MLPCFYVEIEVRQLCLIVLSVSVAFSFVVIRHHPKSWLLQDALGIIFCIYMIKTLRMPNLMVIGHRFHCLCCGSLSNSNLLSLI